MPTSSTPMRRLGTCSSRISTSRTVSLPSISNGTISSIPLRRTVISPWAAPNGDPTKISAVSPAAYSSWSGITVASWSSNRRLGSDSPPLTHTVISLRLSRPASSTTDAAIR